MLHGYEPKKPTAKMIDAQKLLFQEQEADRIIKAGGEFSASLEANKEQITICQAAMAHMIKTMGEHAAKGLNPKYRAGSAYRTLQRDLASYESMRRILITAATGRTFD